jgi:hypothetical protein
MGGSRRGYAAGNRSGVSRRIGQGPSPPPPAPFSVAHTFPAAVPAAAGRGLIQTISGVVANGPQAACRAHPAGSARARPATAAAAAQSTIRRAAPGRERHPGSSSTSAGAARPRPHHFDRRARPVPARGSGRRLRTMERGPGEPAMTVGRASESLHPFGCGQKYPRSVCDERRWVAVM